MTPSRPEPRERDRRRVPFLDPRRRDQMIHQWETGLALASSRLNRSRRRARTAAPAAGSLPDKPPRRLRVLTLNVAHGRKLARHQALVSRPTVRQNLDEIGTALRRHEPDVVALQEADGPSAWSGNFDHVATLSELGGLVSFYRGEHNSFGVGRLGVTSGTALLARWSLREPSSHRFGLSWRDTKGFVVATTRVPEWGGLEVDFVSVHLEPLVQTVRRRQIEEMAATLRERPHPRVVMGDLNCGWKPRCETLGLLTEALGVSAFRPRSVAPTYPAFDPRLRLDWILVSPELRFVDYHTLQDPLSDHLGVVADLELPG